MADNDYPILEFDSSPEAVIEPKKHVTGGRVPPHVVLCFFQEVIEKAAREHGAREVSSRKSEFGRHPVYQMDFEGKTVAFVHPGVGAALGAGILEEIIALGAKRCIACGASGVLAREIAVGHFILPVSAIREEGTSYHYLPPAREIEAHPEAVAAIEGVLKRHKVPHVKGKTWTTDAFYRETRDKVKRRRQEGCLTVEMEAAAFFAVARFRGIKFGQILYGSDDVSSEEWDNREWEQRIPVREKLFWLAVESVLEMPV